MEFTEEDVDPVKRVGGATNVSIALSVANQGMFQEAAEAKVSQQAVLMKQMYQVAQSSP